MANLVAADYAVIVITMIISSGIGVYYWLSGGKQKLMEVSQFKRSSLIFLEII